MSVRTGMLPQADEKSIPAGPQPREDDATHRHPRPCEWPEVLPCRCTRPSSHLSAETFARARQCERIGGFFRCVAYGRAASAEMRREQ